MIARSEIIYAPAKAGAHSSTACGRKNGSRLSPGRV